MVTKGEKLGHFAYGGSLIILLFEKNRYNSLSVQQGQQIGIFNPGNKIVKTTLEKTSCKSPVIPDLFQCTHIFRSNDLFIFE